MRVPQSEFLRKAMDILKFEKMYALLVAEGIEPREFADDPAQPPVLVQKGYQTELVSLCGGQTAGKTGKTGCVLLKMS